jgi:hypothetical protein
MCYSISSLVIDVGPRARFLAVESVTSALTGNVKSGGARLDRRGNQFVLGIAECKERLE